MYLGATTSNWCAHLRSYSDKTTLEVTQNTKHSHDILIEQKDVRKLQQSHLATAVK